MLLRGDKRHFLLRATGRLGSDGYRSNIMYNLYLVNNGEIGEKISLGCTHDDNIIEGFLKYLDILDIQVEEASYAEIVEVFDLMQINKKVLPGFDYLHLEWWDEREGKKDDVRAIDNRVIFAYRKKDVAETYRDVIHPPKFITEGGERRIVFWMADLATRDLERWQIIEDADGERRVEGEVVEKDLVTSITLDAEDE